MPFRDRVHKRGCPPGDSYVLIGSDRYGSEPNSDVLIEHYRCQDMVDGTRQPHPLRIDKEDIFPKPMNGQWGLPPYILYTCENWADYSCRGSIGHLPLPPVSEEGLAATVMARSNPSRPVVDLPLFMFELREFPRLVKWVGDTLLDIKRLRKIPRSRRPARTVAQRYIEAQFGWAPLISDLTKLIDFQSNFDKRVTELERLHSAGGLRRRITLPSAQRKEGPNTIALYSGSVLGSRMITTTRQQWGTVRWKPILSGMPAPSSAELRRQAHNAVLGVVPGVDTLWNAIPWTWFIDWFSNAGDYVGAYRNSVGAQAGSVSIMTKTITAAVTDRITPEGGPNPGPSGGGSLRVLTTKERSVNVVPMPVVDFQFLNPRQASILGSLSVLKIPRNLRYR